MSAKTRASVSKATQVPNPCFYAFLPVIFLLFISCLPPFASGLRWNDDLQKVVKLGKGFLKQPEDVCVDKEGTLYTATRDGWIKRKHRNGLWEDWKLLGGDSLLGLAISRNGDLLVCDANKGLLKVTEQGVVLLSSKANGSKIRFADDVIEESNGNIYFSDVSSKYGLSNWTLDVLEGKPHGRLLKYSPRTKETSVVLDHLSFPNGVALSRDQQFLIFCETWRYRCLKYWLKGKKRGNTEIFIDNLPGGPDNINLAPDGSFWIALLKLRKSGTPQLIMEGLQTKAMAVKVAANGTVIKKLEDSTGKVLAFVTSALEYEGHLYLGNLNTTYIGKLKLK